MTAMLHNYVDNIKRESEKKGNYKSLKYILQKMSAWRNN